MEEKKKKQTNRDYMPELIFTFIFKELLYVILPLIVIIFTYYVFKKFDAVSFFASSDLAFAVTVLNATALSGFIELKVKHQNPNSFTLFEGAKLYILLVVVSTLVLAFIVLNEINGLGIDIEEKTLCMLNVSLFIISASSIFMKDAVLIKRKYKKDDLFTGDKFINYTKRALYRTGVDIDELLHTIKFTEEQKLKSFKEDFYDLEVYKKHETEKIKNLINQNKEKIELLEKEIDRLYK